MTKQWGVLELAFDGPKDGNPFIDVEFAAIFALEGQDIRIPGFYDGDGRFLVRFMPNRVGVWTYRTDSNVSALAGHEGTVSVEAADSSSHGPVGTAGTLRFRYEDGTSYIPIGTTVYALPHQPTNLIETTLASLAAAPFNKVQLCVFPKHFKYNENEPPHYPFLILEHGRPAGTANEFQEDAGWRFDLTRFENKFFRHLEELIRRLGELRIEVDLILFHPYDRWGFSHMSREEDLRYLNYVVARLSAFANVWWSMANEFDVMSAKSDDDWRVLLETVAAADPYGHLRSVHNCFRLFDHTNPLVTHVSVQRDNPANVAVWSRQFGKPAIDDECGYEGDLSDIWGNLSGREMLHRFWLGLMNGGYVTHGETFRDSNDVVFWAKGGTLRGESVARIGFLAEIMSSLADREMEPQATVQRLTLLVGGVEYLEMKDLHAAGTDESAPPQTRMILPWFHTIGRSHDVYLTYFGGQQPSELVLPVPHGETYRATLLDTWGMTKTVIAESAMRGEVLEFPSRPYQAVLLERVDIVSDSAGQK